MNKVLLPAILLATSLLFPAAASASTLYLSPGSGSIGVGSVLSVQVRLNTAGEGVNAVSVVLSYPTDKLDVSYVSGSGTFAIEAEKSFGGGIIKISQGNINPVSGNVSVATIGFRGKSLGAAAVSFIGGSAVPRASDSSDSYSGGSGGTYNVVASVPNQGGTSATGGVASPVAVKAPKITDVQVTNLATSSATISWKTDKEADSYVEYGLDKGKYFLNASNGNLMIDHSLTLEGPLLTPGVMLHFRVLAKDDSGNLTTGEDMLLQLKGFQLKIKLTDKAGQPLKRVVVRLYSDPVKATTDDNGEVSFDNVTPGKHLLVVESNGAEKTSDIEVKTAPVQQTLSLNVDTLSAKNQLPVKLILVIAGLVVMMGIMVAVVMFWRRRRKFKPPGLPQSPVTNPNEPTVIKTK